jgi:DNA-directed RNA polymerase specialized sigma24 family protein
MTPRIDAALCEGLVERAATGDVAAWQALIEALWPHWQRLVRGSGAMGPLARSDDHVHDVLANLVAKLRADGGLRHYPAWRARHPALGFDDWVRIVTANAIRDHLRAYRGSPASDGEKAPSAKRLLNEFTSSTGLERVGFRPPMTDAQTAIQLMAFAESRLPREQHSALRLWLEGASFEEIDEELGLELPDEGRRLVRAAVATLRRTFAPSNEGA